MEGTGQSNDRDSVPLETSDVRPTLMKHQSNVQCVNLQSHAKCIMNQYLLYCTHIYIYICECIHIL